MEEGTHEDLPAREFGVLVGEQTEFRFFASSTRRGDRVGTIIDSWGMADADLVELPPMRAVLEGQGKGQLVPVRLRSVVTEVGTLQVFCLERDGPGRWKLEFDVRGAVDAVTGPGG
jgi:hypothetical protein